MSIIRKIKIGGITYDLPSGGSGTSDYSQLTNKPQINGNTLNGNKTSSQLGLASASDIPTKVSDLTNDSGFITGLTILTYGSSTWNDFITAFNANKVVFVRCGAGTTPGASTKPILAHLVKIDYYNGNPRYAEFRFDDYVDTKTYANQDDHIRIYKLFPDNGWTLTTVPVAPRIVAGDGINYNWEENQRERTLTLSLDRASITTVSFEVVQTLPATGEANVIYLVPKPTAQTQNVYDEYIYTNNAWEKIGDTEIDLSNYYTKTQTDTLLDGKVDKVSGKGLSTNDYTTTEKDKLANIAPGAEVNVQADWEESDTSSDAFIKNKPTIITYGASNGMTLTNNNKFKVGERWTAITHGLTWSRLFYSNPTVGTIGSSGILAISCTRTSVVVNLTLLITTSHQGAQHSSVIELASSGYSYSSPRVDYRIVVKGDGRYYFEIYDDLYGATSGSEQTWYVCYIPLTESSLTKYTTFTSGSSVPSDYTAKEYTSVIGSDASAIRNITTNGSTLTATRQDGTTFTFNLGTASAKDVPASGNASASQVVMGNDTRLSDSRSASDVYAWAKASTKPTYTKDEVGLGSVPNVTTNNQQPTFTQASSRVNIASGDRLYVIFGKIMKWFADLKDLAFISKGTGSSKFLREDGTWQEVSSGSANWGQINGTLSNQTDLQNALNAKLNVTNPSASGTFTMDGSIEIPPYTGGDTKYISSTGTDTTFPVLMHLKHDAYEMYLSYGGLHVTSTGLGARYSDRGAKIKVPNTSYEVNLGDTVLWTNPSPTASFAAQTVTLSQALSNFDYFTVICTRRTTYSELVSSGYGVVGRKLRMFMCANYNYVRNFSNTDEVGTSMTISECSSYRTYGNSTQTTDNGYLIPYQIIGWKFHNY